MKSIVLSSVVTALLVFSGCSTKEPAVDTRDTKHVQKNEAPATQEVQAVSTETVSSEDSMVQDSETSVDNGKMSIADIEAKLPSVYFDFDKYNIKQSMQERVDNVAQVGKSVAKNLNLKLEGNCDEWGSDEYNFALGLKRANAVKKVLVSDGIDASRISMISYGESNPVCTEKTKECWAKNRRVDFKVLP
jgi:peptidoglycan-associated lipoprotein